MRRLFSNFARGAPGIGLLLMRLATGAGLIVFAIQALGDSEPLPMMLAQMTMAALGILIIAGLWTPVAGVLASIGALFHLLSSGSPRHWFMLAVLGSALALTGPGVWSVDARLFGWKRLKIPDPRSH